MRVIHVAPIVTDEAAGAARVASNICASQNARGIDASLAALDWAPNPRPPKFLKTFPLGWGPRRLGNSPSMRRWLHSEAHFGRADIIHGHGLWMMPNVYPGWACHASKCHMVTSPHGSMSPWAMKWHAGRKLFFWKLIQRPAIQNAACFHATAESEYNDIRELGFKQPVCIIPGGVDIFPLQTPKETSPRHLLFLGRIHPVKGIDILLRAWSRVQTHFPDWTLDIAGPDDGGYLPEMQRLASSLKLERVAFLGPLYGEEKRRAYESASLFVLPTHSENFGMTVAESLAAGTPAIVTKGAPWSKLPGMRAGWWIDIGTEPLTACLKESLNLPQEQLLRMGQAGKNWIAADFAWANIANSFEIVYRWLLTGGSKPTCVKLS